MAGYNEQLPDGSWQYVTQNPDGSYNRTTIPPSDYAAANIPSGGGSSAGGGVYQTRNGPKTAQQMADELRGAGGNPPSDPNALLAMYQGVDASGAAAGGAEGYNSQYYQLIQQGIDATVKNALAAGGLSLQAAKDAADNIRNLISTYGDQAYQYLAKAGELGVSVADVMSRLTGPANAFAYDRASNAFRGNGLGDSVQALQSGFKAPSFGALGATSPMTLASMGNDVAGNNGSQNTGTGGSIIDRLLGLAGIAEQGYQNASNGKVPFSIPQFDAQGKLIPGTGSTNNQTAVTPAAGSDGLYQTSNGPKSVAQMLAELDTAAGGQWKDGDRNSATAIASAYAHTTGGTVTPPQTATSSQTANAASQSVASNPLALSSSGDTGADPGFTAPTAGVPGATQDSGTTTPDWLKQYSPDAQKYLLSLPDPSQVNARNYAAMDPSQQSLVKAGYSAKGYDPVSLESQWNAMLPQFKAPSFALVS